MFPFLTIKIFLLYFPISDVNMFTVMYSLQTFPASEGSTPVHNFQSQSPEARLENRSKFPRCLDFSSSNKVTGLSDPVVTVPSHPENDPITSLII